MTLRKKYYVPDILFSDKVTLLIVSRLSWDFFMVEDGFEIHSLNLGLFSYAGFLVPLVNLKNVCNSVNDILVKHRL